MATAAARMAIRAIFFMLNFRAEVGFNGKNWTTACSTDFSLDG
jgi:hypothetical protein